MKKNESVFNFDDAVSVKKFFKDNRVKGDDRKVYYKTCHPYQRDEEGDVITDEDGNPISDMTQSFEAIGLSTGMKDGQMQYSFFVLSKEYQKKNPDVILNKAFFSAHHKELMLIESDKLTFGVCFLPSANIDNYSDYLDDDDDEE